jgi:hypothetical protein
MLGKTHHEKVREKVSRIGIQGAEIVVSRNARYHLRRTLRFESTQTRLQATHLLFYDFKLDIERLMQFHKPVNVVGEQIDPFFQNRKLRFEIFLKLTLSQLKYFEALLGAVKALVDSIKALINSVEPLVNPLEPLVDSPKSRPYQSLDGDETISHFRRFLLSVLLSHCDQPEKDEVLAESGARLDSTLTSHERKHKQFVALPFSPLDNRLDGFQPDIQQRRLPARHRA